MFFDEIFDLNGDGRLDFDEQALKDSVQMGDFDQEEEDEYE